VSNFTPKELEYLQSQWLGRLATVGADGTPHIVPLAYRYNPTLDTLDITGYRMRDSKKWRDIQRSGQVAFLVDDVLTNQEARGIEVRGTAVTIEGETPLIRITARRIIGWGLDTGTYERNSRSVNQPLFFSHHLQHKMAAPIWR